MTLSAGLSLISKVEVSCIDILRSVMEMCSLESHVLNGEFYAQRYQKLIYLHLFTECFMKISLKWSEQNTVIMK